MSKGTPHLRVLKKARGGDSADSVDGESRTLCGRDYIVVPVVALVEGVRHAGGSPSPELVMSDAFGRHVETWNGRPIVVNHPVNARGVAVLAGSPEVLESSYLGDMRNSRIEDGKLLTEAWLDLTAIASSENEAVTDIWKRLVSGETIEVSVGAIVYTKSEEGTFSNKKYSGRWDIVIPDHLAFLDGDQIGACSVEDGCGTFRTQTAGHVRLSEGIRMAAKSAMKTVSSGTSTGSGKRTAECSCKSGSSQGDGTATCGCKKTASSIEEEVDDEATLERLSQAVSRSMFGAETFDMDRSALLNRALRKKLKTSEIYVTAYNDKVVVFMQYCSGEGYVMYQLPYSSSSDDEVTLGDGSPTEVIFQAKVVPVGGKGEGTSNKEKNMSGLKAAAAKSRKITDEDEEPDANDPAEGDEGENEAPAKKGKGKKMSGTNGRDRELASIETLGDLEKELSGTPLGKQLSQALKVASAAREKAITHILSHPQGKQNFTKEMLETVDFAVLDKMASAFTRTAATTEVVEETEEEENLDLGYMDYEDGDDKKKAGGGAEGGANAQLAGKKGVAGVGSDKKKLPVTTYAGRPGGKGDTGSRGVPTPPDIFSFGSDGKLVS